MFMNVGINDNVFTNDFYKPILVYVFQGIQLDELEIGIQNVNDGISFVIKI
jgi:hypothetical protein